MLPWPQLSPVERLEAVKEHARRNLTERQIAQILGAGNGAIRTLARKHFIILRKERDRKADEACADAGASGGGNMWALDDERRRARIARRASKGATETLKAFR